VRTDCQSVLQNLVNRPDGLPIRPTKPGILGCHGCLAGQRLLIKHLLQDPAILVLHGRVRPGADLGDRTDGHLGGPEIDQSLNSRVGKHLVMCLPQQAAGLGHGAEDAFQVASRRHLQVDHGVDKTLGVTHHALDLAVGNDVDLALAIADVRDADADRLDDTDGVTDLDVVADQVLIFKQDEEAGYHVGYQALGAEADRQAKDADAVKNGRGVDAQDIEHHERGTEIEDVLANGVNQRGQGASLLVAVLFLAVQAKRLADQHLHEFDDDAVNEENADAANNVRPEVSYPDDEKILLAR